MLRDELFVRSPKGMVPTPRAEQLATPVSEALDGFQRALEPSDFEPSSATHVFRIAADNYAAIVLVGSIACKVLNIAPGVTMDFRPSGRLDVADLLDQAKMDLAIGPFAEQSERFSRQLLVQDEFVAVLRKNHPAARTREFTMEEFAALPQLEISSVHHDSDFFDKLVVKQKAKQRIVLRAPFLSAVRILAHSDLVCVLPRRIARELTGYRPLTIRPLSHPSPIIETAMIWPRRLENQPAHRWLRDTVAKAAAGLRS
jgi:DNA-binding transcriptional LysR family regulator